MTRVNLENNNIYAPTIKSGLRKGTAIQTITGNVTLVAGMPVVLGFDPTNTDRTITMEAVPAASIGGDGLEHDIVHFGTGTGNLIINNPAATKIGSVPPGGYAKLRVINGAWVACVFTSFLQPAAAAKDILTFYTTLIGLVNTQVLALPVPYNFTLTAVGFRVRTPATTAAKLATLTAQVNGVSVTGGVISLTSANATPTNTLVAGTAITAGNTGTAGQTVSVVVSAVTAFAEGDGQVEFQVTNTG